MADRLHTVQDYYNDVRTLIQDTLLPYRYDDDSIITAFNTAMLEGRRLRPDLFMHRGRIEVPFFTAVSGETVPIESQFRQAFVYGIVGHTLLRDEEDVQDTRANTFTGMFHDMLTGVRPGPIQGGTPGPQQAQK